MNIANAGQNELNIYDHPHTKTVGQLFSLRRFFEAGNTRTYDFRRTQLLKLKSAIIQHEQELYDALYSDLKKSSEECWATELGIVITEINFSLKNLRAWMKPTRVKTNLLNKPSTSFILHEPLGITLIIAPWNYPFQLLFAPLVGAIAAGNCIVLKPSEFATATSHIMKQIIEKTFQTDYVLFAEGDGATIIPDMMNNFTFDHVFYTGSPSVGKIVYKMAAERLVPVTLELGGKNPCIVESDANLKIAARRIALTKFSNAGQMCVAPDYVLIHASVKDQLLEELKKCIRQFYSDDPLNNADYGKIINEKQFKRLITYLSQGEIFYGGKYDVSKLYIEPTIMVNVPLYAALMQDEIFGPILPVISFTDKSEALHIIGMNKNPLSLFVFTNNKKNGEFWLEQVPFGGGCINNASWHFTNHHLPFGGRGKSGLGNYHGKNSFETFSHKKSVMKTPVWFDPAIKYPPFKGRLNLFKRIIK